MKSRNRIVVYGLLLSTTLIAACQKQQVAPDSVIVLGHGGMGVFNAYPINSMESLLAARYAGADGVEIDIQLSRDGIPIAFHDERLDQSTNLSGRIRDKTWAEIDRGFYTALPYQTYSIVRLEEVFHALRPASGFWYALDCKRFHGGDTGYATRLSAALLTLIDRYNLMDRVLIESGDTAFLNRFKGYAGVQTFYLGHDFQKSLPVIRQHSYTGLATDFTAISAGEARTLHDAGRKVILFNMQNKQDNAEALEKHPDFIETDRLKAMLNQR